MVCYDTIWVFMGFFRTFEGSGGASSKVGVYFARTLASAAKHPQSHFKAVSGPPVYFLNVSACIILALCTDYVLLFRPLFCLEHASACAQPPGFGMVQTRVGDLLAYLHSLKVTSNPTSYF